MASGIHQRVSTASNAPFRALFEFSLDAILVIDPAGGEIVDANVVACHLLGYTLDELQCIGMAAIHPTEMDRVRRFTAEVFEKGMGWTRELSCRSRKGIAIPAEISATAFLTDGRPRIIAVVRDLSRPRPVRADLAQRA